VLTDPKLRGQVDALWNKLWTGGLSNPLDAIEQLSYLLFFKRLDDEENRRQRQAERRNLPFAPRIPETMRWSYWSRLTPSSLALAHVRDNVFPWFRTLSDNGLDAGDNSFARYMKQAEFKINKPALLADVCTQIDQLQISQQNQDVQGDLYEYLLKNLQTAGRNGQFRTPRHIIRLMVKMIDPQPLERIGDMAAGTGGFLVNAYQHILEQHTPPESISYDEEGMPHHLTGELLTPAARALLGRDALRGYDNDSGMTMLRIGAMNLLLHGVESPQFYYMDTLSQEFDEQNAYDVILMNPPFKGAVSADEVSGTLPSNTTKSELLFLHLILRVLDTGGRAAVIVPDGVLFGTSKAHKELRRKLIEEHRLDGVVSMPGGVFKPYAGVSTAILFITKGARTADEIWFYDMAHDGFSLDDKRQPLAENDIPDILECWRSRHDSVAAGKRAARLAQLQAEVAPLKAARLELEATLHRLRFESVIAADGETQIHHDLQAAQTQLTQVQAQIAPLHEEIEQLSRHFRVSRAQVRASGYDLTASRYRQVEQDQAYYETPQVTIERLRQLDQVLQIEMEELEKLL
jgi:type I restriction enzyme M protein